MPELYQRQRFPEPGRLLLEHKCADSVNGSRITRKWTGMIRDTHLRDSRAEKGSSSTYDVVADAEVSFLFSSFVGELILF